MAKKEYKIPFEQNGNLLSYVGYGGNTYFDYKVKQQLPIVWEDNQVFQDSFEYAGYSQGRSSCHIYLKSTVNNRKHFVLLSDFDRIMKKGWMNNNIISGKFTFAKRGANFMMVPIISDDAP